MESISIQGNSTLTNEQRLRIQANKERAIARRKEKITSENNTQKVAESNDAEVKERIRINREKALAKLKGKFSERDLQNKTNDTAGSNGGTETFERPNPCDGIQATNKVPEDKSKVDVTAVVKDVSKGKRRMFSAVCSLVSKNRFVVDCGFHQQLQEVFKTMPTRQYDVKARTWSFDISDHDQLLKLVEPLHPEVVIGGIPSFIYQLLKSPENIVDNSTLDDISCKIRHALLPFQREGVLFGIANGGKVLIADDMGLGKTIQAVALADYFRLEWPLLCVVPSSVRYSWSEAFLKWLPYLESSSICMLNTSKEKVPHTAKIVITSYDLMAKCYKEFVISKYRVVIMDESHFLKNGKSARTQAAREVTKGCKRLIMLSGTPALSRPAELYPQLNMLNSKAFNNFTQFGIRYCNGKKVPWGNGWDFKGSSYMKELQVVLSNNIMIRRLKANVMNQLPAKQRSMVILDPSMVKTKTELMNEAEKRMHSKSIKGAEKHGVLLQYFNESAHAKLNAVRKYVEDLVEGDRKFLCFAHHQVMLNNVCDFLTQKKVKFIRIDGHTSSEKRKEMCDAFQMKDIKVAVLSITAANAGITLTAASLVVFAELFWNPGILTQAEDRVHRLGQQDMVNIHYLVAKGTADDFLWPMVQRKLDVLNKAGLSKDNFSNADTKVTKASSRQKSVLDYFKDVDEDFFDEEFTNDAKKMKTS